MTAVDVGSAPGPAAAAGRRAAPRRRPARASGWLLILALLLVWEASARFGWVHSRSWPAFTAVLAAFGRGLADGDIGLPLASTLGRMLAGYGLGSGIGVVAGLLLGASRWVRYAALPLVEAVRPLPVPALVPPLILFLGVDDALKVFVVALSCFFPAALNTMAGVRGVDGVLLDTARTFRVGWMRTVLGVALPAALPGIAAGLRVGLGLGLVVTVLAEMIAGSSGIGYTIVQMQYAMRPDAMYAAILSLAATGYALNRLFLFAEARIVFWSGRG